MSTGVLLQNNSFPPCRARGMVQFHDTEIPVDSVEIFRVNGYLYASIGTYLYDEADESRSGYFEIRELHKEDGKYVLGSPVHRINGAGVLDVRWKTASDGKIHGVWASSDGRVGYGEFQKEIKEECMFIQKEMVTLDTESITMACDLSLHGNRIAAAMSDGVVKVYENGMHSRLVGHSLEAWTVDFDLHDTSLLHSGGDDAKWLGWDLRTLEASFACSWHKAGVCSIRSHPVDPHIMATASYDKTTALWDRRKLMSPIRTATAKSGVWKLKWHSSGDLRVLAACMYDGFHVFDMQTGTPVHSYDPGALSYGCSWIDEDTAVTCSFYNHQVQIWTIE